MSIIDVETPSLVDELIESVLNSGEEYIPALKAADIVALVSDRDPQILIDWLVERAESIVTAQLAVRRGARRASSRRGAFADDAERFENGELAPKEFSHSFEVTFRIDDKGTQKPVRLMTGDDHYYVADYYKRHAVKADLLAAFHVVIAKRVKKRATGEVMSEAEYDVLQAQYAKAKPAA